jgi:MFS family permease
MSEKVQDFNVFPLLLAFLISVSLGYVLFFEVIVFPQWQEIFRLFGVVFFVLAVVCVVTYGFVLYARARLKEQGLSESSHRLSNRVALVLLLFTMMFVFLNETGVLGVPQDQGFKEYVWAVWNNPHEHVFVWWMLLIAAIMIFIQYTKWRTKRTWWALQGQFLANAQQQEQERHERALVSLREARMLEMRERPRQKDTRGM